MLSGGSADLPSNLVGPRSLCVQGLGLLQGYSTIWLFPKIGGPQYRPQYIIVLIMGPPKKGTPNFGKPPYCGLVPISHLPDLGDKDLELGVTSGFTVPLK